MRVFGLVVSLALVTSCAFFQSSTDPAPVGSAELGDDDEGVPLHLFEETHEGMRRQVRIKLLAEDAAEAKTAMDAAFGEVERIDQLMSEWRDDSEVTRLNQAAGKNPVKISVETSQVLKRSLEVSEVSGRAFSLTWAALAGLWDVAPSGEGRLVPTPEQLQRRLPLVDDTKLKLDPENETAFLEEPGMVVGVGGVAKGYAVHRALLALEESGIEDAFVSIGGDIGAMGEDMDGPWTVGVRDPRAEGHFAVLLLYDVSVATSGDYKHSFEVDGVRYHSILDPRTGLPAPGARSVTVIAGDALTADALATAVFVLGGEKGMALIEKYPGIEALIVDADNHVSISSGLDDILRVVRRPTP